MRHLRSDLIRVVGLVALTIGLLTGSGSQGVHAQSAPPERNFTSDFRLNRCDFASEGSNEYFILVPGYRLVLRGVVDGERTNLTISVLDETRMVGDVKTRIVEERETANGELIEVSRNFFAICKQTNSVFYFGEDVDIYENGKIVSHEGSWLAGSRDARPGLIMPGITLLGARYFQEIVPGVALDRAEIISIDETVNTPAGRFTNVLKTEETTSLEPGVVETKLYAPGIGLIQDEQLKLVRFGQLVDGGDK